MNYNQQLDQLLELWEKDAIQQGYTGFCRDGLMYKGEIRSHINTEGLTYWGRNTGNEDEMWHKAEKRILFLMKDTNKNPNQDYREWIGRQHEKIITHKFFKSIALWLTGINSFKDDGSYLSFAEASNPETFSKTFDDLPFAFVNCKKESGIGSISNDLLNSFAEKYSSYLKEQVNILNPNIIICGGGSSSILNIARTIIYPKLKFNQVNNWIYYNSEKDLVLIDSYHPSSRHSFEDVYTRMLEAYKSFIISNKNGQIKSSQPAL